MATKMLLAAVSMALISLAKFATDRKTVLNAGLMHQMNEDLSSLDLFGSESEGT